MIVELRNYLIRSGRRSEFLRLFVERTVPLQRRHGIAVLGPFVDCHDPNRFHWARGYRTMDERERLNAALYSDPEWVEELRSIMLPMLVDYQEVLTESDAGFFNDFENANGP